MTILRLPLLSCLAVVAIAGCSSTVVGTLDYQITGGFGGVHRMAHIEPDGTTTRTKADGSTETIKLDADLLDQLESEVSQAQFPTLQPMYGCGGCADDFVHTISAHVNGSKYTVIVDDSADYPERLRPLIQTLSTMVNVIIN